MKSETREETFQLIPKKYKGSQETTINNYTPTTGQPRRNG